MKQKLLIMFSYVLYYHNYQKKNKSDDVSPLGGAFFMKDLENHHYFDKSFAILVKENNSVKAEILQKGS